MGRKFHFHILISLNFSSFFLYLVNVLKTGEVGTGEVWRRKVGRDKVGTWEVRTGKKGTVEK